MWILPNQCSIIYSIFASLFLIQTLCLDETYIEAAYLFRDSAFSVVKKVCQSVGCATTLKYSFHLHSWNPNSRQAWKRRFNRIYLHFAICILQNGRHCYENFRDPIFLFLEEDDERQFCLLRDPWKPVGRFNKWDFFGSNRPENPDP